MQSIQLNALIMHLYQKGLINKESYLDLYESMLNDVKGDDSLKDLLTYDTDEAVGYMETIFDKMNKLQP